jgi:hypothetical protein
MSSIRISAIRPAPKTAIRTHANYSVDPMSGNKVKRPA